MYTFGLLSCLPRFLLRPIAAALLSSLLLASCGSQGRIVIVYPIDSAPVKGRLIAVHDDCAIIDTTCGLPRGLDVKERLPKKRAGTWRTLAERSVHIDTARIDSQRAAAWKALAGRSVRIDIARMEYVNLVGENYIGSALLVGFGITALVAGLGALSASDDKNFKSYGPWTGAAIGAIYLGIPALLISLIVGGASSHEEETLHPEGPGFLDSLMDATALSGTLPSEADSLRCDDDLQ